MAILYITADRTSHPVERHNAVTNLSMHELIVHWLPTVMFCIEVIVGANALIKYYTVCVQICHPHHQT